MVFKSISTAFGYSCLYLLTVFSIVSCQDFGYDGKAGPMHWGEQYGSCFGKHQSPINIDLLEVKRVRLSPLEFKGFDEPLQLNVTNNGHTAQVSVVSPASVVAVTGGPLNGDYEFSQLHFHWGDNDTFGSEDHIDSHSFPMELHMVFYKKKYRNARSAMDYPDGLTVLAFFYQVQADDNPSYAALCSTLSHSVTRPHSHSVLPRLTTLASLVTSGSLEHYFTYNGSLTTPPCSEVVVWLDFEHPVRLSHAQLQAFRSLQNKEGQHLTHNFRPIQPLGDRVVLYNTGDDNNDEEQDTTREQSTMRMTTESNHDTTKKQEDMSKELSKEDMSKENISKEDSYNELSSNSIDDKGNSGGFTISVGFSVVLVMLIGVLTVF